MQQQSLYSHLPSKPGVYVFKDKNKKTIYIGKARDLKKRVSSYFSKTGLDAKTLKLVDNIHSVSHIRTASEIEAFLLEASLIKKHKPFFNIQLRDDISFPYIKITKDRVPHVSITRNTTSKNAEYFGPYTSAENVKTVLRILRKVFPFHTTKQSTKRKSLYHHLGLEPWVGNNDKKLRKYKSDLRKLKDFLNGKTSTVVSQLKKEQEEYIKKEEFEKAQDIQEKIYKIDMITSEYYQPFHYEEKPNFYFERLQKELTSLQKTLSEYGVPLKSLNRIECYDISNFQGKLATGSMVVFLGGEASKSNYRKFKIKTKNTPDDFHMVKEVLFRRFKHKGWGQADLIVIDGGKGQVSSALQILAQRGEKLPVIGLAKRKETIIVPTKVGTKTEFLEIQLNLDNPGINLLRRIRDEAHRFALAYHRLLRKKQLMEGL